MKSQSGGPMLGPHYHLRTNRVDRAQSLVVALLVLLGATVAALLVVFLFREFRPDSALPDFTQVDLRGGSPPPGLEKEIEPPGVEEAPQSDEPQLQETLQELSVALTSKKALVSETVIHAEGTASKSSSVGAPGADESASHLIGETRDPPKELRFEPESLEDYAAMLDYYGATLVVLEPKANRIHFATDLTHKQPTTRDEAYSPPREFYLRATGPPLAPLEVELARKAGIMRQGGILLTLWPEKVQQQIYQLEKEWMDRNGRTRTQVEKTIYRVEKVGREYKMRIEEQIYIH